MRKMPKYNPIKNGSRNSPDRRDLAMGFMAVVLILSLMACGVVALAITGLFAPAQLTNPLIETPEDRLNISPPPTFPPSASVRTLAALGAIRANPIFQIASSSGKKSGVSEEQRQQIEQETLDKNLQTYSLISDSWEVDDILNIVEDIPAFFVPEQSKVTVKKSELDPNPALPDDWINILLLGTDDRKADASDGRTDVMIVASINPSTGEIKLASLARDIYIEIPMLTGKNRLNAAHAFGGPNLIMKAVNTLFDLNVTRYVRVNLHGLVDIIGVFGGMTIELIPGEAEQINYNVAVSEDFEGFEKNEDRVPLKKDQVGLTKLDPLQTLGYARIRHLDSDLNRINRQRVVLDQLLNMAMSNASPARILQLANIMMPYTATNVPISDIVRIGASAVVVGIQPMQSLSIPMDGSFRYEQADENSIFQDDQEESKSVLAINLNANKEALHTFIYGQYIPRPAN
ncbi:MAG: LCP family protein [Oscillospiraceae bacterium]|jgi:LCP family protein required for cell wall assembly|nr:LCP family protein [Oscillospiraceae bacterium]